MRLASIYTAIVALTAALWLPPSIAHDITWAGNTWHVRSGAGKPCGSNAWDPTAARVDGQGWLHLKMSRAPDGRFACVELESTKRFGFGHYAFDVRGPIGAMDPNLVLGIFLYPPPDVGPDGTNEIDIEIARWGMVDGPQINYTAWNRRRAGHRHTAFFAPQDSTDAHFDLTWQPGSVSWQSSLFPTRTTTFRGDIANQPQTMIINLWLYKHQAPADERSTEFQIRPVGTL